jgi:hypothetical protein
MEVIVIVRTSAENRYYSVNPDNVSKVLELIKIKSKL